jgi:hypothetical protein
MSEHEPHISGEELRAALAQKGRSRPNPLMTSARPIAEPPAPEPPAWEWTTDEQAELEELRESAAELQNEIASLRSAAADARAREHEVRKALRSLAEARPWQRRTVVAELAGRGLL